MIIPGGLLTWVNRVIPQCNISNFGADWKDGKAICELVNYLRSGTLDSAAIENGSPFENANMAITAASEYFQIPRIIEPSDLLKDNPDDFAIITYLSAFQFYDVHSVEPPPFSESIIPEIYNPDPIEHATELSEQVQQFEKEFSEIENDTAELVTEISSEEGGKMTLDDGASLQVLPGSSECSSPLTISAAPPENIATCTAHDSLEGTTAISVYSCEPHGEEFTKPVLLKLPYDESIPIDRLGVFHMKTDKNGQPIGSWELVEAEFKGSQAILLANHFSVFGVFEFVVASLKKKAKLKRTKVKSEIVLPGLTYRGQCKKCKKDVNCAKGFGTFNPQKDAEDAEKMKGSIVCACGSYVIPDRFLLYDTNARITEYSSKGEPKTPTDHEISDAEAVCFGITSTNKRAKKGTQVSYLKVECKVRPNSDFGIDICFVMDCTGSMDTYIEAARNQIMEIATNIEQDAIKTLPLKKCKVRVAFVGYRDFLYDDETGEFEAPEDLYYEVQFSDDIPTIVAHVASQTAYGGGDACENLVGGLNVALGLDWQSTMKAIVLVTDAPCHGKEFHDHTVVDSFPDYDPSGTTPTFVIDKMLHRNINLIFLKITNHTDIMIEKFRAIYASSQHNIARDSHIEVMLLAKDTINMGRLIEAGIMKTIRANIKL